MMSKNGANLGVNNCIFGGKKSDKESPGLYTRGFFFGKTLLFYKFLPISGLTANGQTYPKVA
jgi:hypothetical protein